jgi:hypothetical protein
VNEYVKLIIDHIFSWPVVVLVIALVLHKHVRELLSELTSFIKRASHMSFKRGETTLQAGVSDASLQAKQTQETVDLELGTGSPISLNKPQLSADVALERQAALDYGKGMASVLYREDSIKSELARLNFPLNEAETTDLLIRNLAASISTTYFERAYRWIFGSQISALDFLNTNGPTLATIVEVIFFDSAKTEEPEFYGETTFEQWLSFLLRQGLVAQENDTIGISVQGRDFLVWMVTAGLSHSKAH